MTDGSAPAETAFRVADRLKGVDGPWEVFGQRARRYEIYFQGTTTETVRGPIRVEGYGLRIFRPNGDTTGVGFQSSTDLSAEGVRATLADAESLVAYSPFPAARVGLPSGTIDGRGELEILDRALWERPRESLEEYAAALRAEFVAVKDVVPTFGAVRLVLDEVSLTNSAGARVKYRATAVDLETMVKAFGGPEGRPPGEYWATSAGRRLDSATIPAEISKWCRHARAVRTARPAPSGELPVVLPPEVLAVVLPRALLFRCSGAARLQNIAATEGEQLAAPSVSIYDDGLVPWAPASQPADAEGAAQRRQPLFDRGTLATLFYDALHAGAFDRPTTGNARRSVFLGIGDWQAYRRGPSVGSTTLSIAPGDGGTDEELVESVDDGLWIQEIGFPNPDRVTTAFGGEIRIGYRIHRGKIEEPIRGGTAGGVVLAPAGKPSLLASIAAIGSRPSLTDGVLSPSIVVRNLAVAGATGA